MLPSLVRNLNASANFGTFARLLLDSNRRPRVLVVGGRTLGAGMDAILENPTIELVETDLSLGPRTQVICDANDLPFADETFDGAVAQAILDDVPDPARCVDELHRVLNKTGVVYAETPFLYPVHDAAYDFVRFTHLGHRWLFRRFEEISSGPVAGPATALACVFEGFLVACFETRLLRTMARVSARLAAFWLKYLDHYLITKSGAFDCSIGYFFMGKKSDEPLSSGRLTSLYRGWRRPGETGKAKRV
jgi:SAM-dependent methyltransferase